MSGGAGLTRLPTSSRADQVRSQLEAAIRRGDYPVGSRLPSERELTELLGVSRVSVREGIRSLEAIGLVEVRHGNGCFVVDRASRPARELLGWLSANRDAVRELLAVRGALDEVAAAQAAERDDPEAVDAVRERHRLFLEAATTREPDLAELARLDEEFHIEIARASGSRLLVDLLTDLHRHHLADARRAGFLPEGRVRASVQDHSAIVDAIVARDPAAARSAVAAHIGQVRETLDRID